MTLGPWRIKATSEKAFWVSYGMFLTREELMAIAVVLDALRERNELPDIEVLRAQFAPRPPLMPFVQVKLPATAVWAPYLEGGTLGECSISEEKHPHLMEQFIRLRSRSRRVGWPI